MPTYLLELDEKQIDKLKLEDATFNKKIQVYINNLYKQSIEAPLDYIIHDHERTQRGINCRRNTLKNVIAKILQKNRKIARQPKLGDLLKIFEGQERDVVANKLLLMYGKEQDRKENEDPRYEELMTKFHRMNKVFTL